MIMFTPLSLVKHSQALRSMLFISQIVRQLPTYTSEAIPTSKWPSTSLKFIGAHAKSPTNAVRRRKSVHRKDPRSTDHKHNDVVPIRVARRGVGTWCESLEMDDDVEAIS